MNRLSQNLNRAIISSSSIDKFLLTRISIIHEEMTQSLALLNLYILFYKIKLRRLTKTMHSLQADLLVAHDFIRKLFKANQTRKSRKKTQKKMSNVAFERMLTEVETTCRREDKTKKIENVKRKKLKNEAKKLVVIEKKSTNEIARQIVRQTKKKTAAEKKRITIEEIIDRKKKRKKMKFQKKLKKVARSKRRYRRRTSQSSILMTTTSFEKILESENVTSSMKIEIYVYE